MNDFAVMICTHGRPYTQHTLKLLRETGYTGKIYLIVDDEDDTVDALAEHNAHFDVEISMFNKEYYFQTMDKGTIDNHRACILYAKGYCEDLAVNQNLKAFVIADDDLLSFRYRYPVGNSLKSQKITHKLDEVLEAYVDFMIKGEMTATGFGFAQFYFTGVHSFDNENMQKYRIPYNFVIRNTKYPIKWLSWFGEDIITGTYISKIGYMCLDVPWVQQEIFPLATQEGGMKDTYDSNSNIALTMQNLKYLPAELKAFWYKERFMTAVRREHAFPKLISSSCKKE